MKRTEPAVGIGIGHGMAHGTVQADFVLTKDNRLVMQIKDDALNVDFCFGRATKKRIDFIVDCLNRMRIHALDD